VTGFCECGTEASNFIKKGDFLTSRETFSFSRRTLLYGVRSFSSIKALRGLHSM
jgi:hypothetical protein